MANSRQLHLHRDPFQRPSLTPGPLGHNDAASPSGPALVLTDTPGPLGKNDAADPSANDTKKARERTLQNSQLKLPLPQVQTIAREITTYFEGGGYAALAGDSDQQATSFRAVFQNRHVFQLGPLLLFRFIPLPKMFLSYLAAPL